MKKLTHCLGFIALEGDQLRLTPCFPKRWTTYKVHYRYRQTVYHITMTRRSEESVGVHPLILDGAELILPTIPLVDDQREHYVEVNVS